MAGAFDRLQKQIDDKRTQGGISVLDLADLSPALRKIMKLMLRQLRMDYPQMVAAMEQLPEDEQLAQDELDEALEKLVGQAWLIQIGEGERAIYKVNLRRKAGSKLGKSIWQNLEAKLKENPGA